ncbi:MAG: hypothetical protein M1369_03165 [Deinococcus sp.]|nr:hypothetical protein [Deinococcus sp.]
MSFFLGAGAFLVVGLLAGVFLTGFAGFLAAFGGFPAGLETTGPCGLRETFLAVTSLVFRPPLTALEVFLVLTALFLAGLASFFLGEIFLPGFAVFFAAGAFFLATKLPPPKLDCTTG